MEFEHVFFRKTYSYISLLAYAQNMLPIIYLVVYDVVKDVTIYIDYY